MPMPPMPPSGPPPGPPMGPPPGMGMGPPGMGMPPPGMGMPPGMGPPGMGGMMPPGMGAPGLSIADLVALLSGQQPAAAPLLGQVGPGAQAGPGGIDPEVLEMLMANAAGGGGGGMR